MVDQQAGYADAQAKYRDTLLALEQKSQEAYDKTVLTLSGGALALSMAFIKDVVPLSGAHNKSLLFWAWAVWAGSMACSVMSFYVSGIALRKAICELDDPCTSKRHKFWDALTNLLNAGAGAFFILGVFSICIFAWRNI